MLPVLGMTHRPHLPQFQTHKESSHMQRVTAWMNGNEKRQITG